MNQRLRTWFVFSLVILVISWPCCICSFLSVLNRHVHLVNNSREGVDSFCLLLDNVYYFAHYVMALKNNRISMEETSAAAAFKVDKLSAHLTFCPFYLRAYEYRKSALYLVRFTFPFLGPIQPHSNKALNSVDIGLLRTTMILNILFSLSNWKGINTKCVYFNSTEQQLSNGKVLDENNISVIICAISMSLEFKLNI